MTALLEVEGLRVRLPTPSGFATVVDGVDYQVEPGQVFGVAGESGSGKTMSMLALLGLLPAGAVVEGQAIFGGKDLHRLSGRDLRAVSGRDIGMVFQDPMTSLHPMLSVGRQLTEHVRLHLGIGRSAATKRAADLLEQVRIPDPGSALRAYPQQFSGRMRHCAGSCTKPSAAPSIASQRSVTTLSIATRVCCGRYASGDDSATFCTAKRSIAEL